MRMRQTRHDLRREIIERLRAAGFTVESTMVDSVSAAEDAGRSLKRFGLTTDGVPDLMVTRPRFKGHWAGLEILASEGTIRPAGPVYQVWDSSSVELALAMFEMQLIGAAPRFQPRPEKSTPKGGQ